MQSWSVQQLCKWWGNVCDTYAGFCSYRYAPVCYMQAYDVIDFIEKQVYLK